MKTPLIVGVLVGGLATSSYADLIHHYTFDSTLSDSGSGGLDLTLGSNASLDSVCYRMGGGALRLDSSLATDTRPASVPAGVPPAGNGDDGWDGAYTTDNVDLPNLANGNAVTIAAWVLPNRESFGDGSPGIVTMGQTPGTGLRLDMILFEEAGNTSLRQEIEGGNARVSPSVVTAADPTFTSLSDGNWHHIAIVVPTNTATMGDARLYVDGFEFTGDSTTGGDLIIGNAATALASAAGPIHIGDGINGNGRDYEGLIDDVRIYDEPLDAAAIASLVSAAAGQESVLCDFDVSASDIVAGQRVDLTWNVFGFDTLTIDNGIGDVASMTADGAGSRTVYPLTTTTYVLTGVRGGLSQNLSRTVTVQSVPFVAANATPPFSDGSVPAEICWKSTSLPSEFLASSVTSLTGAGTILTDSAVDYNALPTLGGAIQFTLDAPYLEDGTAFVSSIDSATQLTLSTAVGTTVSSSIVPIETGLSRCYEADGPTAASVGLADSRWPNCINPTGFLGDNGAAEFEDEAGVVEDRLPVAVSDSSVPGITAAYESGDTIGKARLWYGALPPHDAESTNDSTMEVWFKPNDLVGGSQAVWEFGGNGLGSYLALVDDTLTFHARGTDVAQATYTLTNTDWVQAVCVFHNSSNGVADDFLELYINGVLVSTSAVVNLNDYSGADDAGLGGIEQTFAGAGPLTGAVAGLHFEGQIAIARFYSNALSRGQIENNYLAITQNATAAQSFVAGASYTLQEYLGTTSITIDDDDPATSPSPLYTTTNPTELGEGCFSTPFNVTNNTIYTVTADSLGGNASAMTSIAIGGAGASYPELALAKGPVAYYRFNEPVNSPGIFDSSGNGNHSLQTTDNIVFAQSGPVDGTVLLDGDQAVRIPFLFNPQDPDGDDGASDDDADGNEGFTVEGVFQPDFADQSSFFGITAQDDLNGTGRVLFEINTARLFRSFLGGVDQNATNRILENAWCHYAMTCEYDSILQNYTVRFYQDGVLDGENFGILVENSEGAFILFDNKGNTARFAGLFDELAIYDRALSAAELKAHADAVTANSQIALMAFGPALGQSSTIGLGDSTDLFYKVGGGGTGTIDNGVGVVGPGSGTVTVSPGATTDYVLTVGPDSANVTVTVLGDIEIVNCGVNASGFFGVSVKNLSPDREYDLFVSTTLVDGTFQPIGVTQAGAGETPVDFFDNIAFDAELTPTLFYRVEDVTIE